MNLIGQGRRQRRRERGETVGLTGKRRATRAFGLTFVLILALSACSSSSKSGGGGGNTGTTNPGKPKEGGKVTIAMEAETTTGWCLPEAQLAAAGIQVARAIYDTLTVPDAQNNYVPFLASKIDHNANYTTWTITVRDGIKFHDGTPLNAQAVKDNLDAYTGKTDSKNLLFRFEFDAQHWISNIKTTGPMTVEVDLLHPWVAFPAHLYAYGRLGMEAEAQLHSGANCFKDMIGTGPFMFKGDWVVNDHLTVVKNPNYWRKDQYGQQLPYLDQITFKPVVDTNTLTNGLLSKQYDLALTDSADAVQNLTSAQKGGQINWLQDTKFPETTYAIFNTGKAPFDDINARKAYAFAVNSQQYNQIAQHNLQTKTAGPFGPGTIAYVDPATGYPAGAIPPPAGDIAQAKKYAAAYQADTGQPLTFTYLTATDANSLRNAKLIQGFMQSAGITMRINQEEQSQNISDVIAKNFQVSGWRNHPGFDPDTQWIWWHCYSPPAAMTPAEKNIADPGPPTTGNNCDNPVNFSGFNDSVINKDLETGRSNPDTTARSNAYKDLNVEFTKQLWEAWGYYSIWTIPYQKNVNNILGPNLPTASSPDATPAGPAPFPGLSSSTDISGLWLS
jgi:peptide/nickel transport system substrate-binding protein